ncbi:hypothetical protein AB2I57_26075 (plasmid) [Escherichia coli]
MTSKTLKSDVSKLKNDQGEATKVTKSYVDSKNETVGDWSASWYQQVLPTSGAIFGRKPAQLTGRQVLR